MRARASGSAADLGAAERGAQGPLSLRTGALRPAAPKLPGMTQPVQASPRAARRLARGADAALRLPRPARRRRHVRPAPPAPSRPPAAARRRRPGRRGRARARHHVGLEVDRRERRLARRAGRRRHRARPPDRPARRLRDGRRRAARGARRRRSSARSARTGSCAWHRRLGPWPLYLLLAHAVLITVGYARQAHDGRAAPVRAAAVDLPRDPRRDRRLAACCSPRASPPTGSRAGGWPTRPGGRCTSTPTSRCSCRSRTRSTPAPRSSGIRSRALVDRAVGRDARRRRGRARRRCRSGARCATGCGSSGSPPEGPGVVSVVLRGRRLDRLPVAGGQFFQWRFLRRGLWWQAHPYSLSAAPRATAAHHGQGPR